MKYVTQPKQLLQAAIKLALQSVFQSVCLRTNKPGEDSHTWPDGDNRSNFKGLKLQFW